MKSRRKALYGLLPAVLAGPAVRPVVELEHGIVGVRGQHRPVVAGVQPAQVAAELEEDQAGQEGPAGDRRAGAGQQAALVDHDRASRPGARVGSSAVPGDDPTISLTEYTRSVI